MYKGSIHPSLSAYVECVKNYEFGIDRNSRAIVDPFTFGIEECNKIAVTIPYCNKYLRWEMVFNLENLFDPPDVIPLDTEVESISVENLKNIVPSLVNWCPSDKHCLLKLILELLELHKMCQVQKLRQNRDLQRQHFEYESLTEMGCVDRNNIEVSVETLLRGAISVDFLIGLNLNLDNLPLNFKDPKAPVVFLTVSYRVPGNTNLEFKMWSELEKLIREVKIPSLAADQALIDYVPVVERLLGNKVHNFKENFAIKQRFFCAVASRLGTSILNSDSENFSKISFLLKCRGESLVGLIEIPMFFPVAAPVSKIEDIKSSTFKELKTFFDGAVTVEKMAHEALRPFYRLQKLR